MRLINLLVLFLWLLPISVFGQQIVGGEYFINNYQDFGKGTPFTLSSNEATLELDVNTSPEGMNLLYIRTKNNLGIWSMTTKTAFFKYSTPLTSNVTEAEYFIDNYGDFGTGNKFEIEPGQEDYILDFGDLAPGLHLLYFRVKNSLGKWSHIKKTAFFIADKKLSKIVSLRYQFVGEGFESEIFTFSDFEPALELEFSQNQFLTNASALEEGKSYRIKLIALNEKGHQSMVYTATFTYSIKPALAINNIKVTDLTCFGFEDGRAEIEAEGEDIEIEYSIDNATFQDSGVFENLAAGEYTAYIRDKNDIENLVQKIFEVVSPPELQLSISNLNQPSCPQDATGGFTVNATGGAGSYTYKLSTQANFQTENQFAELAAGEYSVTVRDANGCETSSTVQISAQSEAPPKPTISIQGTDAISTEVQLQSSSATGNQWLRNGAEIPGATGQSLEITQAGNYQVRVTNGAGCAMLSEVTLITELGETRTGSFIKLFPNPANDRVKVQFEREFFLEKISIVNAQGILINILEIQRMTDEVMIEVGRFAPGNYILLVEGVGMNERLNLIKK